MQCPLCKLEGRIVSSKYFVEGDESKDTETKLYFEQETKCVNKQCPNYEKVFDTNRYEIKIG